MNNRAINFIKNFSYTLTSNFVSLLISTLVVMVVPKLIGVEEYGYWQLYLFYSSYVGFLHLGWNDGIYLRYGGSDFNNLDREVFFKQFHMLAIFQILIAIIGFGVLSFFDINPNKLYTIHMTILCMVIMNISMMLLYILQTTNRIKEFARITIIDRISYCSLLILFLILGVRRFEIMIVADLVGKLISLFLGVFYCRNIVFYRDAKFRFDFRESFENISVGIKLMLSNIASLLIIGVVRLGIEGFWDVETFGKVSLTLSISNLMLVFINAIGLIMFPVLRRVDRNKLPDIYKTLRDFLMVIMFGTLTIFYPLRAILGLWLPEYTDSLLYMGILFPISIYEGKMSLLINTYLKTMREEKAMLKINTVTLILSVILTAVTTIIFENLNLAVLSIVILLLFRSIIAEIYLSKIMRISVARDILLEISMTLFFIINAWFGEAWSGLVPYIFAYIIYLLIKKNDIINLKTKLKTLLKT